MFIFVISCLSIIVLLVIFMALHTLGLVPKSVKLFCCKYLDWHISIDAYILRRDKKISTCKYCGCKVVQNKTGNWVAIEE